MGADDEKCRSYYADERKADGLVYADPSGRTEGGCIRGFVERKETGGLVAGLHERGERGSA